MPKFITTIDRRPALQLKQVAEQLGVSTGVVLTWITNGELKAVDCAATRKSKRRFRITAAALEEFIISRSTHPPASRAQRRRRVSNPNVTEYF